MTRAIPDVTVAVATYQRAHLLPRLVAALEAQTLAADRFEVVIADNGSTDRTRVVLEELGRATSLQLRTVRLASNHGPSAGRNAAWRAARAPVVAFTDDDCLPTPEWLEVGLRAITAEPRGVVVGRTAPVPDQAHLAAGPFARTVQVDDASYFQTCNIFYRRTDLEAVGGFDETFDQPAGEDTDLGLRVCEQGGAPRFEPGAVVHHEVRPTSFRATVRETMRWVGLPRVVKLHPDVRRHLHLGLFWKPSHVPALMATVGIIGARRWWPAALLAAPYVRHRMDVVPLCPGRRCRLRSLPGALAIDLLEVAVMVRGSLRERTVVL